MCGIYGQLSAHAGALIESVQALDRLRHRGPDDGGSWSGPGVFLGMRRLSIIDLDLGQQPMWDDERTCCIVYNGELYNFVELRRLLAARGHRFRTRSDTEVVLHAWLEWGPACLRRFNGMFALAIWDRREELLFLARDRLGEKPLYYHSGPGGFVFASEIKALLASGAVPRRIDLRGLSNYLAFGHSVAPQTMFEGVRKLLPGHYALVRRARMSLHRWWDVGDPADEPDEQGEPGERVVDLLSDSVRLRLTSDVPVGAFLSGGLDSSAIVALMAQHAGGPVRTFSLGFTIGGDYDELSDARLVAQRFGTEHHELRIAHLDLVECLQALVYHYDEPFGDAAAFPLYVLSRFAREHVKVVLTGDGGDELFGGYRRYAADSFAARYQQLPGPLVDRAIPALVNRLPALRRLKRLAATLPIRDPARRYASWLLVCTPELQRELLQAGVTEGLDSYDPAAPYARLYRHLNGTTASDHLNRLMYVDLKTWLADAYLEKTDKATMACSLEARLPLLDHRLVEHAFQIPGRLKVRGLSTKRIFRQAVADLVPAHVLAKPKHGFSVPMDAWFRSELRGFAFDILMDDRTRSRGWFDHAVVERLWKEHMDRRHVRNDVLWLLLNFELWHRMYLDGDIPSPARAPRPAAPLGSRGPGA
jgi:asparagine synthase (glutamine-hydrolysing)